eukprot:gene1341-1693_t
MGKVKRQITLHKEFNSIKIKIIGYNTNIPSGTSISHSLSQLIGLGNSSNHHGIQTLNDLSGSSSFSRLSSLYNNSHFNNSNNNNNNNNNNSNSSTLPSSSSFSNLASTLGGGGGGSSTTTTTTTTTSTNNTPSISLSSSSNGIGGGHHTINFSNLNNSSNGTNNSNNGGTEDTINNDSNNVNFSNTTTRIDFNMIMKWLEQNFPFMVILLVLFLYIHRQGILVFLWQQIVFIQANQTLKNQVSLKDKRNVGVLLWLVLILSSNIFTTYLFFSSNALWRSLILFVPDVKIDVWTTFWVVIINDFIARFITMMLKAICVVLIGHRPPYKRRSQLYTCIEVTSHVYRMLIPTPVWLTYFLSLHSEGFEHAPGILLVVYVTFKLVSLVDKMKQCGRTIKAYVQHRLIYGEKPTPEDIEAANDLCAICQEKMVAPILLRCNHMFCEDCVSQWFEREKTCPLCRAPVQSAGNISHSDGTTSLLLQIF